MFSLGKKYRFSNIDKGLVVAGIMHGRRAYLGPEILHIDLTNECNSNCIGCWCRSPLLKDKEMPLWEKKQTLPLNLIKTTLDDLNNLGGLREVKLVGGGEPFMHPNILDIVDYIKNKNKASVDINTNFTLVNEKNVGELIRLNVDTMTVSLWAGDPVVYKRTHPNKSHNDFLKMADMLRLLNSSKKGKPWVKIYNVISNLNYDTVEQMLNFAMDVKADAVQFVLHDPIPERTDCLLLNKEQKTFLLNKLSVFRAAYDAKYCRYSEPGTARSIVIIELDGLIRRLKTESLELGLYDEKVVKDIPCYAGWLFARILAKGDVVPCCKGHRMVMGNIYKDRFKTIWGSHKYREFRHNGKHLDKSHPYFQKIGNDASKRTGCYNCDNLWQNEPMHNLIMSLPIKKRSIFSLFSPK